jgi:hypothetical protein
LRPDHDSVAQICAAQIGAGEIAVTEVSPGQIRTLKIVTCHQPLDFDAA